MKLKTLIWSLTCPPKPLLGMVLIKSGVLERSMSTFSSGFKTGAGASTSSTWEREEKQKEKRERKKKKPQQLQVYIGSADGAELKHKSVLKSLHTEAHFILVLDHSILAKCFAAIRYFNIVKTFDLFTVCQTNLCVLFWKRQARNVQSNIFYYSLRSSCYCYLPHHGCLLLNSL